MLFLILFSVLNAFAIEVVKPEHNPVLILRIVRAEPESFETYTLINHNGREMTLVCANNRVYDDNKKAFLQYRNFYNEIAGDFVIEDDKVCKDLGKFIESSHAAISEEDPFIITLNKKNVSVSKIVYPKADPYADDGKEENLLKKKPVFVQPVSVKHL